MVCINSIHCIHAHTNTCEQIQLCYEICYSYSSGTLLQYTKGHNINKSSMYLNSYSGIRKNIVLIIIHGRIFSDVIDKLCYAFYL